MYPLLHELNLIRCESDNVSLDNVCIIIIHIVVISRVNNYYLLLVILIWNIFYEELLAGFRMHDHFKLLYHISCCVHGSS